jgi:hypothetical protein
VAQTAGREPAVIVRPKCSQHYVVVEELPLDERPGDVRDDFFGLHLPELRFPRGDFFDLPPV